MIIPIIILTIILLLGVGGGVAFWFTLRYRQPTKEITTAESLPYRWSYIMLPSVILALSIIITAYFYHQLPPEVAYHFKLDGSPDRWLGRELIAIWLLMPQLLLTLMAGAITWGITKLGVFPRQPESAGIKPEGILLFMGNMVALPQLILCFAMLDIFSYNAYQIHIMPLWVFALIVMGLGGIALGIFFIFAIRRAWGAS